MRHRKVQNTKVLSQTKALANVIAIRKVQLLTSIDSQLSMTDHVAHCPGHANFQLVQLSLTTRSATTLVRTSIRLDYCNSLLSYGGSDELTQKLRVIQNTAVRVVTTAMRFGHITSLLRDGCCPSV